jgi:hypothetical protein
MRKIVSTRSSHAERATALMGARASGDFFATVRALRPSSRGELVPRARARSYWMVRMSHRSWLVIPVLAASLPLMATSACGKRRACADFTQVMNDSQAEWQVIGGPVQLEPATWAASANAVKTILDRVKKIDHDNEVKGTLSLFTAELKDLGDCALRVPTETAIEPQNLLVNAYRRQLERVRDSRKETFNACK